MSPSFLIITRCGMMGFCTDRGGCLCWWRSVRLLLHHGRPEVHVEQVPDQTVGPRDHRGLRGLRRLGLDPQLLS